MPLNLFILLDFREIEVHLTHVENSQVKQQDFEKKTDCMISGLSIYLPQHTI
jgi:hypothetical protein